MTEPVWLDSLKRLPLRPGVIDFSIELLSNYTAPKYIETAYKDLAKDCLSLEENYYKLSKAIRFSGDKCGALTSNEKAFLKWVNDYRKELQKYL